MKTSGRGASASPARLTKVPPRTVPSTREGLPAQSQLACPLKFSEGLPPPRHVGAAVGAHTAEVLAELGYDAEQIEALRSARALG